MGQAELPLLHNSILHPLTLLSCPISPRGYGTLIQLEHMHNRLEWTAVGQQSNHNEYELSWLAKPFQHRASPSRKRLTTAFATIALTLPIMNRNISLMGEATRHEHAGLGQNWSDAFIASVFISIFTEWSETRQFSSPLPITFTTYWGSTAIMIFRLLSISWNRILPLMHQIRNGCRILPILRHEKGDSILQGLLMPIHAKSLVGL
jgi:hypothetical protein